MENTKMETNGNVKMAVMETRLNAFEKNLNEHRDEFKEFVKDNSAAHKEVQASIHGLQKALYAALSIVGFITFMAQVMPAVNHFTNDHGIENISTKIIKGVK